MLVKNEIDTSNHRPILHNLAMVLTAAISKFAVALPTCSLVILFWLVYPPSTVCPLAFRSASLPLRLKVALSFQKTPELVLLGLSCSPSRRSYVSLHPILLVDFVPFVP